MIGFKSHKKKLKIFSVSLLVLLFASFSTIQDEANKVSFNTEVDGKPFELREDQLFRGLVVIKTGSLDGRMPTRTVINNTFNGLSYNASEGRLFNETLQFEIGYEPEKIGEPSYYAAALQYKSGNYYLLKETSKLSVTQFIWEDDKKHFLLGADYTCQLRSWGAPDDGKKDVSVSGSFTNIRITVPSWVTVKN